MELEKKRSLAFAVLLITMVVLAVIYFMWGTYLNRATISLSLHAPYEVEVFGEKTVMCEENPCEITVKRGEKSLIIRKEGYESDLIPAEVGLWGKTHLSPKLRIIPYISEVAEIPSVDAGNNYKLVMDEKTGLYKLVESADSLLIPVVVFPSEIRNAEIFEADNAVLIVGDEKSSKVAYSVNLLTKERAKLNNFLNEKIEKGFLSPDGKYFAYTVENSSMVKIVDSASNRVLALNKNNSVFGWSDNSLVFLTSQNTEYSNTTGKYMSYIDLFGDIMENKITLGEYHPDEDTYTRIEVFENSISLPKTMVVTSNGAIIYLQAAENSYTLRLKRF